MRLMPIAATTALTVLPFALAAPADTDSYRPTGTVSVSIVAPGGNVALNLDGCGTGTGRALSSAFGEVNLSARPGNLGAVNLAGSATVHRNAATGVHPVTFECGGPGGLGIGGDPGGRTVTVNLTVAPGAARGGVGGSFHGMSPSQIAVGGALVAAALGAGVWVLRRRGEDGA